MGTQLNDRNVLLEALEHIDAAYKQSTPSEQGKYSLNPGATEGCTRAGEGHTKRAHDENRGGMRRACR